VRGRAAAAGFDPPRVAVVRARVFDDFFVPRVLTAIRQPST
jgi:hypothetical protein